MNLTTDSVNFSAKTNLAYRISKNSPLRQKAERVSKLFQERTAKYPNDTFMFVKDFNEKNMFAEYNINEASFPVRNGGLEYLVEEFPDTIAADALVKAFNIFRCAAQIPKELNKSIQKICALPNTEKEFCETVNDTLINEAAGMSHKYIMTRTGDSPILENVFKPYISI